MTAQAIFLIFSAYFQRENCKIAKCIQPYNISGLFRNSCQMKKFLMIYKIQDLMKKSSPLKIAIIGANSAIGRRISALSEHDLILVSRTPSLCRNHANVVVQDYLDIPSDVFRGCHAVINCVGTNIGDPATQLKVNALTSQKIFKLAISESVRRFVHISSFSVYGNAELIECCTPERPIDYYGVSKSKADYNLLSCDGADVAILRLPAIVGRGVNSKLEKLFRLWRVIRIFPLKRGVRRSMIAIDAAAEAALNLASAKVSVKGIWLVADPSPVDLYDLVTNDIRMNKLGLYYFLIPNFFEKIAEIISPNFSKRIFKSSVLSPKSNSFECLGVESRLHEEIDRIASTVKTKKIYKNKFKM